MTSASRKFDSGDERSKTPYLHPGESDGSVTIKRCLTASNHGFIYLATGTEDGRVKFLQEYFPTGVAKRKADRSVKPRTDKLKAFFEEGLAQFLQDARALSQINDPHIAHVQQYMENNGTAYITMDGDHGQLLSEHLKYQKQPFSEEDIRQLLLSLMKGLGIIHEQHIYHRDIHPGHIFLRDIGPPLLLGFGTNTQHLPPGSAQDVLASMATTGYSPVERYQLGGRIGPVTDLYSLGAVMYRCITGITPVDAKRRVAASMQGEEDPLVPAREMLRGQYSSSFLGIVDWMLQPIASERPDSVQTVLGLLARSRLRESTRQLQSIAKVVDNTKISAPTPVPGAAASTDATTSDPPKPQTTPQSASSIYRSARRIGWISWTALACVVLITLVYFGSRTPSEVEPVVNEVTTIETLVTEETNPIATNDTSIAPGELNTGLEQVAATELDDPTQVQPPAVELTRPNDNERMLAYRQQDFLDATVKSHLEKAAIYTSSGQLTQPPGESALDAYRAALVLDPGNVMALQGIDEITESMLSDAREQFEAGEMEFARRILVKIETIQPIHFGADELRQKINEYERVKEMEIATAKAAQQRQDELEQQRAVAASEQEKQVRRQQIEELFKKANTAFAIERYTLPEDDNALLYFRQILEIDPENRVAQAGIDKVQDAYLDLASKSIIKNKFDEAERFLELAESINEEAPDVNRLREQLLSRKAQFAQQQSIQTTERTPTPKQSPAPDPQPNAEAERELTASVTATPSSVAGVTTAQQEIDDFTQYRQTRLIAGTDAYYRGDYQQAYNLLKPLADADNARAKFRLAIMYSRGRGVPKSNALARELSRQAFPAISTAANSGEAWAQADMGSIYEDGLIVPADLAAAAQWYRRAAEQGYPGAQTNLGVLYANGEGVIQDRSEAVAWLQRAASQGDKIARENLRALGVN